MFYNILISNYTYNIVIMSYINSYVMFNCYMHSELLTWIDLTESVVYIRYWRTTNHVVVCVIYDLMYYDV